MKLRPALLSALFAALLGAAAAGAQVRSDETPLEDVLEIIVLDRSLLAIDAQGGGSTRVELELNEQVLWQRSRGLVGVVLTDRRILAVGASSAAWQGRRLRRTETPPQGAVLGDRVAIVSTEDRVLGFTTTSGNLLEYRLGPNELLVASDAGANVVTALTSRHALGLSTGPGGFIPFDIQAREQILSISPRANLVTVRTNRRLLIFRGPTSSWEERRLDLSDQR